MHKTKLSISVLMAGVLLTSGAWAADAPSAPVAAPAAAQSPAEAAPAAAATAASVDSQTAPAAVVAEAAAPVQDPVLSDAEGLALLKKSNCLLCHSVDKKIVGPAYKDVAAKYRGQPDAEAKLISKVTKGGSGAWGSAVMPPQKSAGEANIKSLVRFVLARK